MRYAASLVGLLLVSGCFSRGDDAATVTGIADDAVAANALTKALGFSKGKLVPGRLPGAEATSVTLLPASTPTLRPGGGTYLLGFDVSDADETPHKRTHLHLDQASDHISIDHDRTAWSGHVEHEFTLGDDVCDALCDRVYTLSVSLALELGDGRPSRHAKAKLVLDCTDHGRHDRCEAGAAGTATGLDASTSSPDAGTTIGPRDDGGSATSRCASTTVDKVDVVFMVDNSGSMREEQAALKAQFPNFVQTLATGMRMPGDPDPFPPAKDLHLGVVSADMGLIGITGITGCAGFGDDGVMQHMPAAGAAGCLASYPSFLSYDPSLGLSPLELATDLGCLAELGTMGCGFEQPLEAVLKALWPSVDVDALTGEVIMPNRITFLGDASGNGTLGHGDVENEGFLRSDPTKGLSLIAIVLLTDEEDCSAKTTVHFTPPAFLADTDPLKTQDINLRCFYNKQNLYDVMRYVKGYKALREGNEELVVFAGIVGVPPDLVTPEQLANVDFTDAAGRSAHFDTILADPRMQEAPDPTRAPGNGNLTPSCVTPTGIAYPPRRIVEVARAFGQNAVIQSICQADLGPAMDVIVERIGNALSNACVTLPSP